MSTPGKKDLSSLYPQPKSFDDLERERQLRESRRRPRWVPAKIGLWATLAVATLLAAYQCMVYMVTINLSSAGEVLFGVSLSVLLGLAVAAVATYLYWLIGSLAARVLPSTVPLYAVLGAVTILAGIALTLFVRDQSATVVTIGLVLLLHFAAACLATNWLMHRSGDTAIK